MESIQVRGGRKIGNIEELLDRGPTESRTTTNSRPQTEAVEDPKYIVCVCERGRNKGERTFGVEGENLTERR